VWQVIWSIVGLLAAGAAFCMGRGLYLHYAGPPDPLAEETKKRIAVLNKQKQETLEKIAELQRKRDQLGEECEISDVDWWLHDNRWRLQDIDWEIGDTYWEADERRHHRKSSVATFWTVLGAAIFALAGLVVGIATAVIK